MVPKKIFICNYMYEYVHKFSSIQKKFIIFSIKNNSFHCFPNKKKYFEYLDYIDQSFS